MSAGGRHGEGRELWDTQGIALQPWLQFLQVSGVRQGPAPRLELLLSSGTGPRLRQSGAGEQLGVPRVDAPPKAFQEGQT